MTAKQKARDLHTKHYDVLTASFAHNDMSKEVAKALYYGDAINHALVTVKEHINIVHLDVDPNDMKKYWKEVEKELKQLH